MKDHKDIQIAFAFPNPGDVSSYFHYSVVGMTLYENSKNFRSNPVDDDSIIGTSHLGSFLNQPESCYVSVGRSKISNDLIRSPAQDTHVLMIDPDISFSRNLLDLIVVHLVTFPEVEILAGRVNIGNGYPVFYKDEYGARVQQIQPFYGVKDFDGVGTGIIVISRKALEDMAQKEGNISFFMHLFQHGREHGDDFSFCERAKKHGYKLWGAWAITGIHHKVLPVPSKYPETITEIAPGFGVPKK